MSVITTRKTKRYKQIMPVPQNLTALVEFGEDDDGSITLYEAHRLGMCVMYVLADGGVNGHDIVHTMVIDNDGIEISNDHVIVEKRYCPKCGMPTNPSLYFSSRAEMEDQISNGVFHRGVKYICLKCCFAEQQKDAVFNYEVLHEPMP